MFARKANTEKNTHSSTHLVCPSPEGNKYNAAVRWKLPAVTANWLKTCADQLTLVDETPFLVGETIGKLIYIKSFIFLLIYIKSLLSIIFSNFSVYFFL